MTINSYKHKTQLNKLRAEVGMAVQKKYRVVASLMNQTTPFPDPQH